MSTRASYRPAPDVQSVVESMSIGLFHGKTGAVHRVNYPEAAVWDMAARGYEMNRIVDTMRHITGESMTAAEQIVVDFFELLLEGGFVIKEPCGG